MDSHFEFFIYFYLKKKGTDDRECEYCNKLFRTYDALFKHILSIHKGVRFQCPICSKLYTQRHNVRTHMAKKHKFIMQTQTGLKPVRTQKNNFL